MIYKSMQNKIMSCKQRRNSLRDILRKRTSPAHARLELPNILCI